MKRGGPLKRSRLVARSTMSRKAKRLSDDLRQQVMARDGWGCQARTLTPDLPCRGRLHVHHRLPRSRGGPDTLNNLVTLCLVHHDHVHGNPVWAKHHGLLL